MKHIIDLNSEIEKLVNPKVEYNPEYQNIRFFDKWVNEVEVDYFGNWYNSIIEKVNSIADLENPMKVKLLKILHQDVLEKYSEQSKRNYNSLESLESLLGYYNYDSIEPPKFNSKSFSYAPDSNFTILLEKFAFYNGITDYDCYDGNYSPDSHKDQLEDIVLDKLGLISEDLQLQDATLNKSYSYVHLSVCLELSLKVLKNVAQYLTSCINLINKAENWEEDKLSFEEVSDNDPTNLKLKYNLSKLKVVQLYRALFEEGIIHVDSSNQKMTNTNLKLYIDNANIYYRNRTGAIMKVKDTKRQYSDISNDEKGNFKRQEAELLDLIIKKFTDRQKRILESM